MNCNRIKLDPPDRGKRIKEQKTKREKRLCDYAMSLGFSRYRALQMRHKSKVRILALWKSQKEDKEHPVNLFLGGNNGY